MRTDSRYTRDVAIALEVCQEILACTNAEFQSRPWVLERVKRYGIAYNDWGNLARYGAHRNISDFGLLQIPTEFTDFVMDLCRLNIETAIEIGVFRGASSYFIASMLTRASKGLEYTMVDIDKNVVAFDEFSKFLNLRPAFEQTSDNFAGRTFDFVFIDGDHSYQGVNRDIINLGNWSRNAVAFHDIYGHEYSHLDGGTVRAWREFVQAHCETKRIVEYSHAQSQWMGIGLACSAI